MLCFGRYTPGIEIKVVVMFDCFMSGLCEAVCSELLLPLTYLSVAGLNDSDSLLFCSCQGSAGVPSDIVQ